MRKFFLFLLLAMAPCAWAQMGLQDPARVSILNSSAASPYLTSLIFRASLDEASGTRTESVNGFNLTDNNSTVNAAGINSNAAAFTRASNMFLSVADNATLSMGDIDFTCACWVYLTANDTFGIFIGKGNLSAFASQEYVVYGSATNTSMDVSNGTTGATVNWGSALSLNSWHFVVGEHDSVNNLLKISVDGVAFVTTAYSSGCWDGTQSLRIGSDGTGTGRAMNGRVDEPMIWKSRLLTITEVQYLYNSGTGKFYPTF